MKLHWSVKRGGIIVKTYKEHLLTYITPILQSVLVAPLQMDQRFKCKIPPPPPPTRIPVHAWNCTMSTGTCFSIHSTSFSPLLYPVQTNCLWIWQEHTKKHSGIRSFHKAVPTLWNRLPDTLQNEKKWHFFSSSWNFIFKFLVTHCPPHPHYHVSFPTVPPASLFS